jgi:hypothetical protein
MKNNNNNNNNKKIIYKKNNKLIINSIFKLNLIFNIKINKSFINFIKKKKIIKIGN